MIKNQCEILMVLQAREHNHVVQATILLLQHLSDIGYTALLDTMGMGLPVGEVIDGMRTEIDRLEGQSPSRRSQSQMVSLRGDIQLFEMLARFNITYISIDSKEALQGVDAWDKHLVDEINQVCSWGLKPIIYSTMFHVRMAPVLAREHKVLAILLTTQTRDEVVEDMKDLRETTPELVSTHFPGSSQSKINSIFNEYEIVSKAMDTIEQLPYAHFVHCPAPHLCVEPIKKLLGQSDTSEVHDQSM